MQSRLADELKQLLRRIEEVPVPPAPAQAPTGADGPGVQTRALPPARPAGPMLVRHRKVAALLLAVVVAIAGIAGVRWTPWSSESAGEIRPVDDAKTERASPAREEEAPPAAAGAPAVSPPQVAAQAESAEEAHEQAGSQQDALRRSIAVPGARAAPKLTVPAIHATSGQRVRVAMRVEPGTFATDAVEVSVRGLPKGARFVQGTLTAPDRWTIPGSALGTVELALGDAASGRFELVSELHGASGRPIAQTKSALVVAQPQGHGPASPPGHGASPPSGTSRPAVAAAPVRRVVSATNCRPCRCFRASPIYWEYRGAAGWVARAGPPTTTCYVVSSRLSTAQ
jgi:hypothetical protein